MNNRNGSAGRKYDCKDLVKKLKMLPFEKRLEIVDCIAKNMSYEEINAMGLSERNTQIFFSRKHYYNIVELHALEQELKLGQEMEKDGLNPTNMNDRGIYQKKYNLNKK